LHNEGTGRFTDRSASSRVGESHGFWAGASWGDYDRDGYLDLYVTGYVQYTKPDSVLAVGGRKFDVDNPPTINPSAFRPERNLLFHNNRDGTFTEVGRSAGVQDTLGRSLSAAWVDLDEDGWPDLYVANDVSDNVFYRNLGNGTFADLSHEARVADYRSAMGIAVGDWDSDGDQDMFLTHWIAQENALYDNMLGQIRRGAMARPNGAPIAFMDDADRNGLGQATLDFVGWATSFVYYDNDGALDLFMVNGSTLQSRDDPTRLVPMRNQLFWNHGRDGFFDVSPVAGATFRAMGVGRGGALGDYDNDGDVDAFIVNNGGTGVLLRNDGGNKRHWLQVEVRGTKSYRQGIGAMVRVVAAGKSYLREIGAQSSYLSQNSLIENFGLGAGTGVDSIEVIWPNGARDVRAAIGADQRVTIVEGSAPAMVNSSAGGTRVDTASNPSKRVTFGTDRAKVQEFWSLYRKATAERIAGNVTASADTYARALDVNPDHEDVLYYYGSMRWSLGDFASAERSWRHLLEVNASSARTHSQLGRLHSCLDAGAPFNLDSAEAHLRRAHEINKEESGPLVRLGEVRLLRGDLTSADEFFQKVLVTHTQSAPAHFYRGYIAWRRHEFDRARAEFTKSVNATAMVRAAPAPGEGDTKKGTTPLRDDGDRCLQLRSLSEKPKPGDVDVRYAELDAVLRKRR
jgi:tetratricopeptide (TPR) repeat protein